MKTITQLKQETIDHYNRMGKWVLTQPQEEDPKEYIMFAAIGEAWFGEDCPFCGYFRVCSKCPIEKAGLHKEWVELNHSKTWTEWVIQKRRMIHLLITKVEDGEL